MDIRFNGLYFSPNDKEVDNSHELFFLHGYLNTSRGSFHLCGLLATNCWFFLITVMVLLIIKTVISIQQ